MTIPARKKVALVASLLVLAGRLMTLMVSAQEAGEHKPQEEKPYGLQALFDGSGFVRIAAGEFQMGAKNGADDEQPVHRVRISQSFELGKFEVTQTQWEAVMQAKPSAHARREQTAPDEPARSINPSQFKGANLPVENVTWDDVQQFLRRLNALDKEHLYRLPTEAEWEYACRAGGAAEPKGSLDAAAWYKANSGGRTQPVGQKQPNAWGLYDMQGNVWEWCQDWYAPDYYRRSPATDPAGPDTGAYRIYRGGSWYGSARDCRITLRGFDSPSNHYYSLGFRLVRMPR